MSLTPASAEGHTNGQECGERVTEETGGLEHCVRVKEEPDWSREFSSGETKLVKQENGLLELYAGHKVDAGLAPSHVRVKQEMDGQEHNLHIKEELNWDDAKQDQIEVEIMLGPTGQAPSGESMQPIPGYPEDQITRTLAGEQSLLKGELKLYQEAINQNPAISSSTFKETPTNASYHCNLCTMQCSSKKGLTTHMRTHKKKPHNNIYSCELCLKEFKTKNYLKIHRRIHTGDRPYSCDLCTKQFTQKSTLVEHRRSHTGEKPHSCSMCTKKFARRYNLVSHMRSHAGDRPFPCDLCPKRFLQHQHLAKHLRTHTGEKPYSCQVCKRAFMSKHHVKAHMRTHTGDKPFSCEVCHKKFPQKNTLVCHRRIHTGEKPYSCNVCTKLFSNRKSLNLHTQKHAKENT